MIDGDAEDQALNGSEKDLALSINMNVLFDDETRSMSRRRALLKIVTISTDRATSQWQVVLYAGRGIVVIYQ